LYAGEIRQVLGGRHGALIYKGKRAIKILIVDDHSGWRRQARELLEQGSEFQDIYEASDGAEAVQKAGELRPGLIVLDIGLPKLNGIQAARQIRKLSPNSPIVFLTQDSSPDVVQAALGAGGRGYVHKARASCDLSLAVATVLQGKQFVSSNLRGPRAAATGANAPETDTPETGAPERHEVVFYSGDAGFLDSFTEFIAAALRRGDLAMSVTTKPHRDGLIQRLSAEGWDVAAAIEKGSYIPADVADVLSAAMVDGLPDSARLGSSRNSTVLLACATETIAESLCAANARRACWRRARRMQRFVSNNSATNLPRHAT
jgi:DNA-binding NarL/FixJ family response regulator